MSTRMTDQTSVQGAVQQLLGLENYLHQTGLDRNLLELVKMRVSQLNGCAFCLAMHAKALREAGEREDRLHVLPAWRETDWFSDRERAALAWGEAVTVLRDQQVPDDVFEQARAQFSEQDLADLTLAVIAINGWNRANIALTHTSPVPFTVGEGEEVAAD